MKFTGQDNSTTPYIKQINIRDRVKKNLRDREINTEANFAANVRFKCICIKTRYSEFIINPVWNTSQTLPK